ncbi:MAG: hypothetical protein U0S50_02010 [Sphingopyxis sp.]|uniref:DUF6958 family protein n=1 Tax=Sphingopyxis sp. TaxID=1908224 RepID=UPI002AB967F2|nr:hypothetical protein [Sphingopyxis sp.]MDZ3830575.1 hypothetical protein [Sphingopyxis sp.]
MSRTDDRVAMRNINSPDHIVRVERAKYEAMRDAMLAVVPADKPGLTAAEIKAGLLPLLPDDLFPGGAKAGWWQKGVQLDLEARGVLGRADTKPLRFHRL